MNKYILLRKLFKSLKDTKNIKTFYLVYSLVLLSSFMEMIGIGLIPVIVYSIFDTQNIQKLINNYFENFQVNSEDLINYLILLFGFVYLFKTFLTGLIEKIKWSYATSIKQEFSQIIYRHFLNSSYSFYANSNSSNLIRDVNTEVVQFCFNFIVPFILFLSETTTVIIILTALFLYQPMITLTIILSFMVAYYLFFLITNKTISQDGRLRQTNEAIVLKHLQESFSSVKEIKTLKLENFFYEKFYEKNSKLTGILRRFLFINSLPRIWFEFLLIVAVIILLFFVTSSNSNFVETNAILGLYLAAVLRIMPSINRMTASMTQIKFSHPAINKVTEIINKEMNQKGLNKKEISEFNNLEFKNVSFKFPNKEKYILENIDLKIKKNQKIAIVGETGSGKSTFLNILIGLIKPTSGRIVINNNENFLNCDCSNILGYVAQNIFLFDESILKNITVGEKENNVNMKTLENSISLSLADRFIKKLTEGLDTVVGEKAIKISGGQIQRIGIARSLYREPKLLILDEGTSALDLETEKIILDNLLNKIKDLTLIYVTHRRDNLKQFDKILEVKNGKVNQI